MMPMPSPWIRREMSGSGTGAGGFGSLRSRSRKQKRDSMSILVNKNTKVIVQGITGKEGSFHAAACREYGTKIVGGVTPGKGGTTFEGTPVFNTVFEAVGAVEPDVSLIFV